MSARRKKHQYTLTKGQRHHEMARKKEERAARVAYRKEKKAESYLADDETFSSFANQLAKSGLELRDIPGDGNCLFRALADQLDGHCRNHYKHRLDVAQYMLDHRDDFEPFVEDDVPFDRHVSNLKKPGTFAGNDAIVAFARLHKVNVVIHQLNSPCWQIQGCDAKSARQLHISYHNGDHYSSVRKVGDNSSTPAKITIAAGSLTGESSKKVSTNEKEHYSKTYENDLSSHDIPNTNGDLRGVVSAVRQMSDVEDFIMSETGCMDRELVKQALQENDYCVDNSIIYILQLTAIASNDSSAHSWNSFTDSTVASNQTYDSGIWSDTGTGSRLFGNGTEGTVSCKNEELSYQGLEDNTGAKPKVPQNVMGARSKKEMAKREKKKRAEERHRQKILGMNESLDSPNLSDSDDGHNIEKKLSILQI